MFGGISIWQLLILLLIVVLVFGTKRLRNIGTDLGSAIRGFRKGMEEEPDTAAQLKADPPADAAQKTGQAAGEAQRKSTGADV